MSDSFRSQYSEFKRRNGMLPGAFTGRDSLPSMLAPGEMVLNPAQIRNVIGNAGRDVFKGAGIPGYAGGAFLTPAPAPSGTISGPQIVFQPNIMVVIEGEGMTEAKVKNVLLNGLKNDSNVKVQLVRTYDDTKPREPKRIR